MLPPIDVVIAQKFLEHSFVYPNPWLHASGRMPGTGEEVCHVSFGISPLGDRVYVDGLNVEKLYRRRGYASALLVQVARYAGNGEPLTVTPLHTISPSRGFWQALRAGHVDGVSVTCDVRVSEMEAEQERWRHALPNEMSERGR